MVNRITISLRSFSIRGHPDVNTEIGLDAPLQFPKLWPARSTVLPTVADASYRTDISDDTLRNDYELSTRSYVTLFYPLFCELQNNLSHSRLEIRVNVEIDQT